MAMTHQTLSAILGGQVGMGDKEIGNVGFNGLSQELASTRAQNIGQQILEFPWLTQGNNGIVGHGVSLLLGDVVGFVTATIRRPFSSHRHQLRRTARPSISQDAAIRSARRAAMKVSVFQWSWGTGLTSRSPIGQRP
jgi:hypothetical protein